MFNLGLCFECLWGKKFSELVSVKRVTLDKKLLLLLTNWLDGDVPKVCTNINIEPIIGQASSSAKMTAWSLASCVDPSLIRDVLIRGFIMWYGDLTIRELCELPFQNTHFILRNSPDSQRIKRETAFYSDIASDKGLGSGELISFCRLDVPEGPGLILLFKYYFHFNREASVNCTKSSECYFIGSRTMGQVGVESHRLRASEGLCLLKSPACRQQLMCKWCVTWGRGEHQKPIGNIWPQWVVQRLQEAVSRVNRECQVWKDSEAFGWKEPVEGVLICK